MTGEPMATTDLADFHLLVEVRHRFASGVQMRRARRAVARELAAVTDEDISVDVDELGLMVMCWGHYPDEASAMAAMLPRVAGAVRTGAGLPLIVPLNAHAHVTALGPGADRT